MDLDQIAEDPSHMKRSSDHILHVELDTTEPSLTTLRFYGVLTLHTQVAAIAALQLAQDCDVIIDITSVTVMDMTGLRILTDAVAERRDRHSALLVCAGQRDAPQIYESFDRSELHRPDRRFL
jgi:anti-anti-sigma regulatory factor